jgi:hypothetical protein
MGFLFRDVARGALPAGGYFREGGRVMERKRTHRSKRKTLHRAEQRILKALLKGGSR